MPVMSLSEIESVCRTALLNVGASVEQADIVAAEIADAEAEGIRNVGLGYMHLHLKHLKVGKVKPAASPKIVKASSSTTVVDADFGFLSPRLHDWRVAPYRDHSRSRWGLCPFV